MYYSLTAWDLGSTRASIAMCQLCATGQFLRLRECWCVPHVLPFMAGGPGCNPRQSRQIRILCVFLTPSLCKEQCGPQNTIANDSHPTHPHRIPTKGNVFWFFLYLDLTGGNAGVCDSCHSIGGLSHWAWKQRQAWEPQAGPRPLGTPVLQPRSP